MEPRELIIMRHAKSAWNTGAACDFERPLAGRGRKDAPRMGAWLEEQGLLPDLVVCSTAVRARQTALGALGAMNLVDCPVRWEEDVYEAGLSGLLQLLSECPSTARRVMLVGHNPGMESVVLHLASGEVTPSATGKILPTAAVAHLTMPEDWSRLRRGDGNLIRLVRPKEI